MFLANQAPEASGVNGGGKMVENWRFENPSVVGVKKRPAGLTGFFRRNQSSKSSAGIKSPYSAGSHGPMVSFWRAITGHFVTNPTGFLKHPLSSFMHWLSTAYTVYFNRRHQRHGHLLDGRSKAKLVEGDQHIRKLTFRQRSRDAAPRGVGARMLCRDAG
jgi:hypothetical protein